MKKYSEYADRELIALLKAGDRHAFTEIYDRYWATMYAHVYKIVRNREDTLDVLQDLFSSLWLNSEAIQLESKLSGFLYISARNRVFNLIQQHKVRYKYLDSLTRFMEDVTDETVETLEERDLSDAIEAEVRKLPPRVREVFQLSRKKNLSHKEIAKKLNISDQTVRKQIQHALRILRPKFDSFVFIISSLRIYFHFF